MQRWLMLLAGGLLGTAGRYVLTGAVQRWLGPKFPYGTLAVNTSACLVIGFLGAFTQQKLPLTPEARLFLMVGLIGAYSTFSSLIYESWQLILGGEALLAGINLLGSLALGLGALWIGHSVASLI